MEAYVTRNGTHQGHSFIEVEYRPDGEHASPLKYALPIDRELPLGTKVGVTVEVLEGPKELTQDDLAATTPTPVPERVVPTSPIVTQMDTARKDTSPSGQAQVSDEEIEAQDELVALDNLRGPLPEDFPGRVHLEAAGEATFAKLRKRMEAGTLTEVEKIGPETAKKIEEALKEEAKKSAL